MSDLVHEPGGRLAPYAPFVARVELETAARVAMGIDSPWLVPVRSWDPVVHAEPPPAERPDHPLSPREAAICLVQLCDVLSKAHAGGWAGLEVDVHDVMTVRDGDGWRIAVVLPHLPPRGKFGRAVGRWEEPRVRADLRTAVGFFADLVTGTIPDPWRYWSGTAVPEVGDPALQAALQEVLDGDGCPVSDAAGLASLVLPLASELAAVVERMPRVSRVRIRHDWDRLVALGEAELAQRPGDSFKTLPLAAAYHQRAVERMEAGDLPVAIRDLDRAVELDPGPKHLTTRAMARRSTDDLDRAIAEVRRVESGLYAMWLWRGPGEEVTVRDELGLATVAHWHPTHREPQVPYDDGGWRLVPGAEQAHVARALYVRAVWRFEARDVDGAAADLDLAEGLLQERPDERLRQVVREAAVPIRRASARAHPGAETRWKLADALVRVGRPEDAVREAEQVEDPSPHHRWRLVRLLADVGRIADARREADRVIAGPEGERYRKRHGRLFPEGSP